MTTPGDALRDPPLRYLGYAGSIGKVLPAEIIRPMGRIWMQRATLAYIAVDVFRQARDGSRGSNVVGRGLDGVVWQSLASILIPSFILSGVALGVRQLRLKGKDCRYLFTGLALITMPLVGPYVDEQVDKILDETTRPILELDE